MTISTSIRANVRQIITAWGSDASLYSFASATKTTNEEGDVTVSDWGGATAIKVISSNHQKFKSISAIQGKISNEGGRIMLVRDDVTVEQRDRITIGTDNYKVEEVKKVDPIQNTLISQRVVLNKDVNY